MNWLITFLTRKWRHVAYNISEGGLPLVAHKIFLRIKHFCVYEEEWFIYRAHLEKYLLTPDINLEHRFADATELQRVHYYKSIAFPEVILDRYERGDVCHAFYLNGTFVNVTWTSLGCLEIIPGVSISDDSAMGVYDIHTVPSFRRRGINVASQVMIAQYAIQSGVRALIAAVSPGNIASITSLERAGYRKSHRLTYQRRFGFRRVVESDRDA